MDLLGRIKSRSFTVAYSSIFVSDMHPLLQKYKPALTFMVKFFVIYAVLTFAYNRYLHFYEGEADPVTRLVAQQSNRFINWVGFRGSVEPHSQEPTMKLIVNDKYVGRVLEGCNSISVLILFATFVLSFTGRLKTSLLFVLIGGVLLFLVNIFRIGVIGVALYKWPQHQEFLHQIVFPVLIYGLVFLFWMLWVNKFSKT